MAGEAQEVAVERGHVGGHVGQELGAVDEQKRAGRVGRVGQAAHRREGAEHVRHGGDAHQLHAVDETVEVVEVEREVGGHRYEAQLDAPLLLQHEPRDEVGVVLDLGEEHGVALVQVGATPRVGHQVDGLGDVLGEHDLAGRAGADEPHHAGTGALVERGRLLRDRVHAAMDVGVRRLVVVLHGVEHDAGLLRARRGVEVDEALAVVHLDLEDREVLLDRDDVECGPVGVV